MAWSCPSLYWETGLGTADEAWICPSLIWETTVLAELVVLDERTVVALAAVICPSEVCLTTETDDEAGEEAADEAAEDARDEETAAVLAAEELTAEEPEHGMMSIMTCWH